MSQEAVGKHERPPRGGEVTLRCFLQGNSALPEVTQQPPPQSAAPQTPAGGGEPGTEDEGFQRSGSRLAGPRAPPAPNTAADVPQPSSGAGAALHRGHEMPPPRGQQPSGRSTRLRVRARRGGRTRGCPGGAAKRSAAQQADSWALGPPL